MTRRYVNENGWKTYNLTYDGYAGAERVAMRTGEANPLWLLGDHLGSTSVVANYDGSPGPRQGYKAWGEKRFPDGPSPLPTTFRYTGQREASFGLYFYAARWYDSSLGRFSSPDTLIPEASQGVQAWDRYGYTNNNPVLYNDPSGHCLILCTMIIGAAVGAIVGAVGYTAYTAATGTEFNTGHMLMAAGAGAIAGAAIGSGVGLVAAAAAAPAAPAIIQGAEEAAPTVESVAQKGLGNLSHAAEYGIQQGAQLKNAVSGTGLQVHHLIEQRFAPALGQSTAHARQWLSAAVTPQEHQVFTNAWRSAIGYSNQAMEWTTNNVNPTVIWEKAQGIYADYPALLDAAKKTIFGE
jgi:RHS repeat-associated protein